MNECRYKKSEEGASSGGTRLSEVYIKRPSTGIKTPPSTLISVRYGGVMHACMRVYLLSISRENEVRE